MSQDVIVLRDLGSAEGSIVNGEQVRDAVLRPGDQIVFDAHHRFVVEAPARAMGQAGAPELSDDENRELPSPQGSGRSGRRLPWLLLAALLIAMALSALLLFGVQA
jgi:pSer/pThr/pTyr-binding forkhead associated (FHA) protein